MKRGGKHTSLLVVSAAVAVAVGITAASAAGTRAGSSSSGKVTLIWYMRIDPHENAWEKAQIAAYERSHPNIHVKLIVAPNTTLFDTKLNTLLNSSNPPDFFQPLGRTGFADYIHRKLLLNLTPLLKQSGYTWGGVPQSARAGYTVNGGLYAIPATTLGSVVFYNKDLFDQYNKTHADKLAYPSVNWNDSSWTFAKMEEDAKKLTDASNHVYGILDNLYPTLPYAWMAGQQPFSPSAGVPKSFNLTAPATVAVFQRVADWYKTRISPSASDVAAANANGVDLFTTGKIGMMLTGTWGFRNYSTVKFHWAAGALPLLAKRVDATFTDSYVVYKGSKHPREALGFIKFLTGKSAMQAYIKQVSFTPANQNYLPLWYQQASSETGMSKADLQTLLQGAVKYGQPASDHVIVSFGEMYSKMSQDLQPLWAGQRSAADALKTAQSDVTQVIKQIH
jgi:multiple sugar transport system substrate-binding protein